MEAGPARPTTTTDTGASTLIRYQAANADLGKITQAAGEHASLADRTISWEGRFNTQLRFPILGGNQSVEVLSDYDPTVPNEYAGHPHGTSSHDIPKFKGTPETEILARDGHIALINKDPNSNQRHMFLIGPDGFLENATELPDFLVEALTENLPSTG